MSTVSPPAPGRQAGASGSAIWSTLLRAFLLAVAAGVLGGFPAVVWFQAHGGTAPFTWGEAAAFYGLGALACVVLARLPARWVDSLAARVCALRFGLLAALGVGAVLRLAAALALQPEPFSDVATYLALAGQLAHEGRYGTEGARAYWPPGLPLALAPWLAAGLPPTAAVLALNLVCFAAMALGLSSLVRALGHPAHAAVPAWLLALWPTHVLMAGAPVKELLVMALLPWVVLLGARALAGSWRAALGAGVLTGLAVLVQPSLQLLPVAGVLLALLLTRRLLRPLAMGGLVLAAMLAAISPWAARNLAVLGEPVLVSTNGGSVLYRANNDLATGTYIPAGAVVVTGLGEVATDRAYKRLGFAWIGDHPLGFGRLVATKVLLFLGDNSYGSYVAFGADRDGLDRRLYVAIRLGCALPWLLGWALVAAVVGRGLGARERAVAAALPVVPLLVVLPLAYLLAIHAVFESGTKYHLPVLGLVLVVFTWMAAEHRAAMAGPVAPAGRT